MRNAVLGISAFFHDSAAVLLIDGNIVAAAQEERFTRIKNDASFPVNAIKFVLKQGGIDDNQLTAVAYYEKPFVKFERLLETYHAFAPKGLTSFLRAMPLWLRDKLFLRKTIKSKLEDLGQENIEIYFPEHHLSHAASAFYPSPFLDATIVTIDGVGEWATMTIGIGKGKTIEVLREQHFPHSIGLLYSAFTYFLGFEVNKGEYKLMGLAAYGTPESEETKGFIDEIQEKLVDIREDGSILLNMNYFKFATHLQMTDNDKWQSLFHLKKREPNEPLLQIHANLAFAIQKITEIIVCKIVKTAVALTGVPNLVMAGGVALNSVINGKILELKEVDKLWIQPAAGDSGGALGAAFSVWHISKNMDRIIKNPDAMRGAYLGPDFTQSEIWSSSLNFKKATNKYYDSVDELLKNTVEHLANGKVVGWFQGRMEFGPRALGNRSIIADARIPDMQKRLNAKIKFRESFRPFAPSVLEDDVADYFELETSSPYMLLVKPIKSSLKKEVKNNTGLDFLDRLSEPRSDISSVTHVDYSARIQTVSAQSNPLYYKLLKAFKEKTGCGLIINTSFNIKDEPIVCSPKDAFRCFEATDMDVLVIGNYIFEKSDF
ncbi:carbamoyltransferase [Sediminibacter sp. Hel_I_10]|uniref:carbamoyltransferase family protein n=1 Tax=Sediminibacter sp. Hel_I_10 TaxID=1392490 RepID=UPI000563913C|nr:carbamoyltransferase [Sediminibacter sp. Hel_I_10]